VEEGFVLVTSEHRFADCHDVLRLCGNLVSVQDNILSLAHKSVKDFLLSTNVTGQPTNDCEDYEVEIGCTCLTYLAFLGDSYYFGLGRTSTGRLGRLRKSYPFLEYATAMWPHSSQAPFPPNRASRSNTVVPEPPRPSNAMADLAYSSTSGYLGQSNTTCSLRKCRRICRDGLWSSGTSGKTCARRILQGRPIVTKALPSPRAAVPNPFDHLII
jgi:hypothetical protein